jgi:hypothetical protein
MATKAGVGMSYHHNPSIADREAAQRAKEMLVLRFQHEQAQNKRGAMHGRGHRGSDLCFPFATRPSLCHVPMPQGHLCPDHCV